MGGAAGARAGGSRRRVVAAGEPDGGDHGGEHRGGGRADRAGVGDGRGAGRTVEPALVAGGAAAAAWGGDPGVEEEPDVTRAVGRLDDVGSAARRGLGSG